jgi:hypothetical protein
MLSLDLTPSQAFTIAGLRLLFLLAVGFSLLAFGTPVGLIQYVVAVCFVVIVAAALIVVRAPMSRDMALVFRTACWLCALLFAIGALQAMTWGSGSLAHPIWERAREAIGPLEGAISVYPEGTRRALVTLCLPFLVFIAALLLFNDDLSALRLWRWLAVFGVAMAAFGIVQHQVTPDRILAFVSSAYADSVVGTFPNRNTAATFFGLSLVLLVGLTILGLHDQNVASLDAILEGAGKKPGGTHLWIYLPAIGATVVLLALFLTRSRAGILATLTGLAALIAIMIYRSLVRRYGLRRAIAMAAVAPVVIFFVYFLFGGRSVDRLISAGIDEIRLCAYGSTLRAFLDNFLIGTGLGTFDVTFPIYRDGQCLGLEGIWNRAHSAYLEGFLGLGIILAPILAVAYFVILRGLLIGLSRRRRFRFAAAAGLGGLILVTLHSLVDFSIQIPGFAIFFAAFLAASLTLALGRQKVRSEGGTEAAEEPEESLPPGAEGDRAATA